MRRADSQRLNFRILKSTVQSSDSHLGRSILRGQCPVRFYCVQVNAYTRGRKCCVCVYFCPRSVPEAREATPFFLGTPQSTGVLNNVGEKLLCGLTNLCVITTNLHRGRSHITEVPWRTDSAV